MKMFIEVADELLEENGMSTQKLYDEITNYINNAK